MTTAQASAALATVYRLESLLEAAGYSQADGFVDVWIKLAPLNTIHLAQIDNNGYLNVSIHTGGGCRVTWDVAITMLLEGAI